MCFGSCRVTCDNCKPKFIWCPECDTKNLLVFKKCKKCGFEFTEEMKDEARATWAAKAALKNSEERG